MSIDKEKKAEFKSRIKGLLKNLKEYDSGKVTNKQLTDDHRIVHAWWASKLKGKNILHSFDVIRTFHDKIAIEMEKRGIKHDTPLKDKLVTTERVYESTPGIIFREDYVKMAYKDEVKKFICEFAYFDKTGKPNYLSDGKYVYGIISLGRAKPITKESFRLLEKEHKMGEDGDAASRPGFREFHTRKMSEAGRIRRE